MAKNKPKPVTTPANTCPDREHIGLHQFDLAEKTIRVPFTEHGDKGYILQLWSRCSCGERALMSARKFIIN